jgi:hypothetical protein
MAIFYNIFPILNFTTGFLHGKATAGGKKPDPKYTYSLLGISTFFAYGHITNIKPAVHPLMAVAGSIVATEGIFCMGHMTARIADNT